MEDIKDNIYLQHDLNLYNFIISLNEALKKESKQIEYKPLKDLNFDSVSLEEISFKCKEKELMSSYTSR